MKKILVTGITGQDGSLIADFLLNKNYKVIEMDVFRDGKAIGFSNYFFKYENQILEVKNETKFDVQLLGVKIFSIRSKGVEKYFNNKLTKEIKWTK